MNRLKKVNDGERVPLVTFIGGMRYGIYNFTIPLIRLELFNDGLQISSSIKIFRRLIPILAANFEEISGVQIVANWLGSGVRIRTNDAGNNVVFWTTKPEQVLSFMQKLGLSVSAERTRFHFWNPER